MSKNCLVFLAGKRTPFGANGKTYRETSPVDLGVACAKEALKQSQVDPNDIDHVIYGNVLYSAPETIYLARHIGLYSEIPKETPALGINRLCGSGFQVVVEAYQQIICGDSNAMLVGGVENMSLAPYLARKVRWGQKMGPIIFNDLLMESLTDKYCQLPMALTAENLAQKYNLRREDVDIYAYQSHQKALLAYQEGKFSEEIISFKEIQRDEHLRDNITLEGLASLKPVFKSNGVVTAGNASGIVDGAASLIVSSEEFAQKNNKAPLGRLIGYGISGCEPSEMGIGPVPAIKKVLNKFQKNIQEIDLIEVNEAFAAQTLAVQKELEIDSNKLNVNGGAIALGHPLGASGARITMHLLYELRRQKKKLGIASACIGGGQGIALLLEAF